MRIDGIDFSAIRSFCLHKRADFLSRCVVSLRLDQEKAEAWLDKHNRDFAVYIGAKEDTPVFFGRIDGIELSTDKAGSTVRICAVCGAEAEDRKKHFRMFQKPGKTFGDVLGSKRLGMENCSLELDSSLNSKALEPLVIQNETNFAFARRLASLAGRRLWVDDLRQGSPGLALGFCSDKARAEFKAERLMSLRQVKSDAGNSLLAACREYRALGRLAQVEGVKGDFVVTDLVLRLDAGVDVFSYRLEEYSETEPEIEPVPDGQAYLLRGRIVDADDPEHLGRIQFQADDDAIEDADKEKSWLPWLTPYAGTKAGMVFIPEKDDAVLLHVSHGRGYGMAAVRAAAIDEEARNPAEKHLGNNHGRRIIWREKSLELHSGENSMILEDDAITCLIGDARLRMERDSQLAFVGETEIRLDKKNISAKCSGSLETKADKSSFASSGKARLDADSIVVKASGDVEIGGSKVKLG